MRLLVHAYLYVLESENWALPVHYNAPLVGMRVNQIVAFVQSAQIEREIRPLAYWLNV
jgi:hypothetical protein